MPEATQLIHFLPPENPQPNAPLFIYLPGMDGTGELLRPQMAFLEQGFDVRRLSIPVDDLTDWDGLVQHTADLIKAELRSEIPRRSLYLCGESFGGCLALKLVQHSPQLCDRLILVNPASSFNRRPWLQWGAQITHFLPVALYPASCLGLLPFLAALERISWEDRGTLLRVMQSVSLKSVLWRLSLLESFKISPEQLHQILQPTLLVISGSDRLLPSRFEGELMRNHIPNSRLYELPTSGHASLLEADVNLYEILNLNGFLEKAEDKRSQASLGQPQAATTEQERHPAAARLRHCDAMLNSLSLAE